MSAPNIKVSQLSAASALDGTELVPIVQAGVTKRAVASALIHSAPLINAQTGTTYTLQSSDNGNIVTLNNASAITVTCPIGLGAAFSTLVLQLGAGQVSVVAGGGVTLNSLLSATHLQGQYACGVIFSHTANNFVLTGQLV